MTDLLMPSSGPRVPPLRPQHASEYVQGAYDLSVRTWGIPNNLAQTMGWLPRLVVNEVTYANSFIFDQDYWGPWPDPTPKATGKIQYPEAGFVDRLTKELCINLVSLLNRSRYSITHHSFIGFVTLRAELAQESNPAAKAEALLLNLVDSSGSATYRSEASLGLYSDFHLAALDFACAANAGAHSVTDVKFSEIRAAVAQECKTRFAKQLGECSTIDGKAALHEALSNSMLVELSWLIVHFNGLLNAWFTILRVSDEKTVQEDGVDFVSAYNATVPESIKARNNALLGNDGFGATS